MPQRTQRSTPDFTRRFRARLENAGFGLLVCVALLCMAFPFYWVVATSLKSSGELNERVELHFPSMIPASFFLRTTTLEVSRKAGDANASRELDTLIGQWHRSAAIENGSVQFRGTSGQVCLTYDTRCLTLADLRAGISQCGVALGTIHPPRRYPFWKNYRRVFAGNPFGVDLLNSAIVSTCTTLVCLVVGGFCAYAMARLSFPFRDALLALILGVSMFPPIAVVSPLFLVLRRLHLLNTYPALIIPYTAFALPLTIWTLTGFFRELPRDLEDSARVDGCTRLQTFFRIIVPLSAPGVFTCAILVFIFAWNEFLFALVFVTRNTMRTVPVAITLYPGQFEMPWGTIFAAAATVTLPLLLLVFFFQRRIIAGLTAGAVKG